MSVSSLQKLGELVREKRHILLARWRREVRQLPSAKHLNVPTLNDHVPYLIEELADALAAQSEETIEAVLLEGSPPAHGRQRLLDGFDVEEVVAEYNALRGCLHELAEESGIVVFGNDLRIVNRVIDEAIGLAVQTYATQLALEVKQRREEHLSFVAHDLRTPLNAIALTVGVIERTLSENARNAQTEQLLKILWRNIQHLENLVIEVIKANDQSETGTSDKLERRVIDLWPLVEHVIHGLEPVAATASVTITNNVPGDLMVFADAGLLTRVLENLISNAINYAPRGTVLVEASLRDGDDAVECRISDNGPGISQEALRKIFDKNGTDNQSKGNIGLGLAIVKQFIEAHGGTIAAESTEGVGTTFRFILPARTAAT